MAPEFLEQAQDDATILAIRDQELAGLDIVTDGEMRRESYSNRFATALDGVDIDNPGTALDRSGHPNPVPRVVGTVRRKHPVEVRDLEFLRANTDRAVKMTVPGPFTMSQQAQNDFYESEEALALDYAAAVNEEIRDLFAAGADIVQIDEPYMQARPDKAREFGLVALARAIDGVTGTSPCTSASATRRSSTSGRRVLVPAGAGGVGRRSDLDRDRPVEPRHVGAGVAARQDDHPRGARSQRSRRRERRRRRRADPPGAAPRAGRPAGGRARLRPEVPAPRVGVRQDAGDGRGRRTRAVRALGLADADRAVVRSVARAQPSTILVC